MFEASVQANLCNGTVHATTTRCYRTALHSKQLLNCENATCVSCKISSEKAPSDRTIRHLHQKLLGTGNLGNASHQGRRCPRRSDENIEAVQASVRRSPTTSSRRRSSQLAIPRTTLRRIIRDELKLFPYKIQLTNRLLPTDKPRRLEYANFVVNMAHTDGDFWRKIIMSDEAHFSLNGTVNKQNCRFYATENPLIIHEEPLHDQRLTVWAGICAERIIGPFFFEDDAGRPLTVNGDRYRAMITDFLMPFLADNDMDNFWFQQDDATAHTARATIALLRPLFPQRLISKNGDSDWPPRSPDLTPPDFFLWGFLKSKVYVNKPRTLEALKDNIRREMAAIEPETLQKVMENAEKRAHCAIRSGGDHLRDIIFKK